jgi:hypothetical protein
MIVRFEAHVFEGNFYNQALFDQHFRYGDPPWTDQQYRETAGAAWRDIHTGDQNDEWNALKIARSLDDTAGLLSATYGAPQILGENYGRIGYADVQTMFEAFQRQLAVQVIGFFNYCLADPDLIAALNAHDWETVAYKYNGPGQVEVYAPLMANEYARLAAL